MATTPNYGWVTPAPTDFVTDLPADFETFADAVDADLAGLLGGTTGQVLTKDSAADHDFSWTTPASGGATLISTTALSGSTTSVTSIPSGYKHIYALILNLDVSSTAGAYELRFNGATTGHFSTGSTGDWSNSMANNGAIRLLLVSDIGSAGSNNMWYLKIDNYDSATDFKLFELYGVAYRGTTDEYRGTSQHGGWRNTNAITSLEFNAGANTWTAGNVYLYGVN